jgi:hypothetical protein
MHETVVRCDPMSELLQVQLPEEPHSVLWCGEDCEALVPTHPSQARTVSFTYYSFLCELRYSPQCCGSGMFIPDPNFSFADPRSRAEKAPVPWIPIKEFKYFNPKKLIQSSCLFWIPDPGSGSATLICPMKQADPRVTLST